MPERFDLRSEYEKYRSSERRLEWNGTLQDYLDLLAQNPGLNRLSHNRMYDMIINEGSHLPDDDKNEDYKKYNFFEGEIFGIEKTLDELVRYFAAASRKLEIRKRILMLVGPVGGGKSSIVTLLKKGLAEYTKTDEGAVFAIKDCPMHEDPLHLIPEDLRPRLEQDLGVEIEGRLCPVCKDMVREKYRDNLSDVPVERIVFSEEERRGIGTFSPSDPKSQDISELTGSIDLSTIGEYGVESDPRAFRFDGELNKANRGVMEFIEMLKCDEKFLYNLLTLTQEQNIKTGRFALIYADEVIVSHTNEHEFNAFIANKKSEALHDRIYMVNVPYNLRVDDEVKIYEKLISEGDVKHIHIAPETLKTCSMVAVLSRLTPPKKAGVSLVQKMHLYNGEKIPERDDKDLRELKEEDKREGMGGISPRFIINALSNALIEDDRSCINPIDALRAIKAGIEHHPAYDKERREKILDYITMARGEYDKKARNQVQKAFVRAFQDSAQSILDNYLDNVIAYCNKAKMRDPLTGDLVDPNERLMRTIEEQIDVSENNKKAFRDEIAFTNSALGRRNEKFTYDSHPKLRDGIEKKLFNDTKDIIRIITYDVSRGQKLETKNEAKLLDAEEKLVADNGYCNHCARELVKYVGTLLNK